MESRRYEIGYIGINGKRTENKDRGRNDGLQGGFDGLQG